MILTADGSSQCDGCGRDIGNGSVQRAVIVSLLRADGQIENMRLCVDDDETGPPACGPKLVDKRRGLLTHRMDKHGDVELHRYKPAPSPIPVVDVADPPPAQPPPSDGLPDQPTPPADGSAPATPETAPTADPGPDAPRIPDDSPVPAVEQ